MRGQAMKQSQAPKDIQKRMDQMYQLNIDFPPAPKDTKAFSTKKQIEVKNG
jgi:hypothetical protein